MIFTGPLLGVFVYFMLIAFAVSASCTNYHVRNVHVMFKETHEIRTTGWT